MVRHKRVHVHPQARTTGLLSQERNLTKTKDNEHNSPLLSLLKTRSFHLLGPLFHIIFQNCLFVIVCLLAAFGPASSRDKRGEHFCRHCKPKCLLHSVSLLLVNINSFNFTLLVSLFDFSGPRIRIKQDVKSNKRVFLCVQIV